MKEYFFNFEDFVQDVHIEVWDPAPDGQFGRVFASSPEWNWIEMTELFHRYASLRKDLSDLIRQAYDIEQDDDLEARRQL